jgi:hypothetical protein
MIIGSRACRRGARTGARNTEVPAVKYLAIWEPTVGSQSQRTTRTTDTRDSKTYAKERWIRAQKEERGVVYLRMASPASGAARTV